MVRMEISPRDLRDTEIHNEMRGYNRDEVNELLERAAATIDSLNSRVNQMQERLNSAQSEAGRTRETEDILHRTLLLAQRAADEAVAEATAKSRQMLDDAEMQSRRLVADSEADARRKGESERRRLEEEILDLAGRRDALLADVEALTRFEAEYRERMTRALEADLSALRTRPTTAPGQKP
jgi:cell division initiation protein